MKFTPTEIIFSATTNCNLHCQHCFVSRNHHELSVEQAITFIKSCKNSPDNTIQKIGFSGGEPFLYMDFLLQITKAALEMDFMFDQIMTNGDWWKDEHELTEKLQQLYDAGYDGKFGLSWDNFHGQNPVRMETFIRTVQELFGNDSINIQYVKGGESLPLAPKPSASRLAADFSATPSNGAASDTSLPRYALNPTIIRDRFLEITVYELPQTYLSSNPLAWKYRRWFKEDYCEGPGHIFFIHPDGNIAPCCGFANENPQLFIGTINDSFETIMKNAGQNEMLKICFETGLSKHRKVLKKQLKSQKQKYPGKCGDICSFCDFVCKNSK